MTQQEFDAHKAHSLTVHDGEHFELGPYWSDVWFYNPDRDILMHIWRNRAETKVNWEVFNNLTYACTTYPQSE